MPHDVLVRPNHKAVKEYYRALAQYGAQTVTHEGALRSAFQNILDETGRRRGWTLIPELDFTTPKGATVYPDGTFRDDFYMKHGFWEAKDTHDVLEAEIKKKIAKGYPLTNTIFEDTRQAYLYQHGQQAQVADLSDPQQLCDLLNAFLAWTEPAHENFNKAIDEFQQRIPDLARGLVEKITEAHKSNKPFIEAFDTFYELCRSSLNPNLRRKAVDEMLVQHLLTERLIRTIFDQPDFVRRNVIAAEVERVIDSLTSQTFSRHNFLKSLDRFYVAIESAAGTIASFGEKQHFLNTVYERFFQGYSVKVADTHGIVYTPQEIVDFMCASVVEVLEHEFGKRLGDPDVFVLDPCTGTGNFIVNLLGRVKKKDLPRFYRHQLFANEVMLLPYYIASLNIEHAYYEQTGTYEPFEGVCFVDTLDLAEERQMRMFTEENAERVERQRKAPITVVIGNPPYNANQVNENDNNRNRKYSVDERIRETYATQTDAQLKNKLYDSYVKFIRWATDRLPRENGILCFVTNNSFAIDGPPFDGMRRRMCEEFTTILHIDLNGNVRQNPKLSGTKHNVFGIQVGVGITIAVRRPRVKKRRISYHRVAENWTNIEKRRYLSQVGSASGVKWSKVPAGSKDNWIPLVNGDEFSHLVPLGHPSHEGVFERYSTGAKTNRDDVVYGFERDNVLVRVKEMIESYNAEVDRFRRTKVKVVTDDFVDTSRVKWSSTLKLHLERGEDATYDPANLRWSLYRPFSKRLLYYDAILNDRPGIFRFVVPTEESESDNATICCTNHSQVPFSAIVTRLIANEAVGGRAGQCLPFYIYGSEQKSRRENITDWSLNQFRGHYKNKRIAKWDIFHYVYGVLHHPGYRERYADNLKRELPRIPFAPDFRAFRDAGRKLAELHLGYEELDPWDLEWIEEPGVPLIYRVEKMKLAKDKRSLRVNDSLTLAGIPPEASKYRLGNRSALEWVIDQYRVKTDKRSGITSDPNRDDDPEYIVRLVGQVVRVSVETVGIVRKLAELPFRQG